MAKRSMSMTISSDFAEGKKAMHRIMTAVAAAKFNHANMHAIKLALDEAVNNAIKHGNRLDPEKKVRIQAKVDPKQTEIIIEDEGVGFIRERVPDPRLDENLEKCSGRGIFLIESYMDQVEWTQGGRRLRMVKLNNAAKPNHSP